MATRKLYTYKSDTKEYEGVLVQSNSPLEKDVFFPVENATDIPPLSPKIEMAVLFINGAWVYEHDFRGQVWYDSTGVTHEITTLGMPDLSLTQNPTSEVQLANSKQSKKNSFSEQCVTALSGTFQSSALGPTHTYPCGLTDQINVGHAAAAGGELWCQDAANTWVFAMHTPDQGLIVQKDMITFISVIRNKLATLNKEVDAATTMDQVVAVNW